MKPGHPMRCTARLPWMIVNGLTGSGLLAPALAWSADAVPAAQGAAISPAGGLLQVFIGLIAVLLLIAATAWAARRLGVARGGGSSLLQVVGSASVGTRERVVIVEVGESWLVLGVAPGSVNALTTLPKGEALPAASPLLAGSFAASLRQLIEKRHAK